MIGKNLAGAAMSFAVLISACGKSDEFAEEPIKHENFPVTADHEAIKCLINLFGSKHNYVVKYRVDRQPFGNSYIYTLTKNNIQIIVDNPFSASEFEASMFRREGEEIGSRSIREFAELTHSIRAPSAKCPDLSYLGEQLTHKLRGHDT